MHNADVLSPHFGSTDLAKLVCAVKKLLIPNLHFPILMIGYKFKNLLHRHPPFRYRIPFHSLNNVRLKIGYQRFHR